MSQRQSQSRSIEFPYLQASQGPFAWTLPETLGFDAFAWRAEAPAALLLIGMHLSDPRPWDCARRPLFLKAQPGLIDLESKRLLGKRLRAFEELSSPLALALKPLDSIALVLSRLESLGHSLESEPTWPNPATKEAGKLLPRKLLARARVRLGGEELSLVARNFSEISQCLHAELVLLFGLSRLLSLRKLPPIPEALERFEIEATLKPCKMCAAFLFSLREKCQVFSVRYEEDDPGPLARNTLLDRFGYSCRAE